MTRRFIITAILVELALLAVLGGFFVFKNVKLTSPGPSASGGLELDLPGLDMNDDWSVNDVETGQVVPMESYRGEVLVLNLWNPDCPPCLRQLVSLQRLEDTLAPDGLQVLAVCVGDDGGVRSVREGNRLFLPMGVAIDGVPNDFIYENLPVTYVISRTGRIVARVEGTRHFDTHEVIDQMRHLLAEPAP